MLNLNFNDCKDLINYLNKNARRISEARKDKTTTLLHVLATDPETVSSAACWVIDCKKIKKTIYCLNNIVTHDKDSINAFLKEVSGIIKNKDNQNRTAEDIATNRDDTTKTMLMNIFGVINDNDNNNNDNVSDKIKQSFSQKGNLTTITSKGNVHVKNNEELGKLITTILNGLKKTNNSKNPIKGGAQDDGLVTFIVRVLKSISENSNENTDMNESGQATGFGSVLGSITSMTSKLRSKLSDVGRSSLSVPDDDNITDKGSNKSSLMSLSNPFSKKDKLDLLLSDIIDIILNIANNEPLPLSMKDKLLSGLGKFSGIFKGVSPEEDTGVFVPVDAMGCSIGKDSNPIAKIDNECIDDKIDK